MANLYVFDFDDTLAKTMHLVWDPYYEALWLRVRHVGDAAFLDDVGAFTAYSQTLKKKHGVPAALLAWQRELSLSDAWRMETSELAARMTADAVAPHVEPNRLLLAQLGQLQKRGDTLMLFTMGHPAYLAVMLAKLELGGFFSEDRILHLLHMGNLTKETPEAYQILQARVNTLLQASGNMDGFDKRVMVEDSVMNLREARAIDYDTWLVGQGARRDSPAFVSHFFDHVTDGLACELA